jgi:hypothetical protein
MIARGPMQAPHDQEPARTGGAPGHMATSHMIRSTQVWGLHPNLYKSGFLLYSF